EILNSPEMLALYKSECQIGSCASPTDRDLIRAFGYEILYPKFITAARPKLREVLVKEFETDFTGKATLESLEPGDYWIFGSTRIRRAGASWNQKVTVGDGTVKVTLDHNNSN